MLLLRQCHRWLLSDGSVHRHHWRRFYHSTIHRLDRIRIGSVEREIIRIDHLSNAQRQKIPRGYLQKLQISLNGDNTDGVRIQRTLSHLQWLMQKDILRQDAILVGSPSTLVYRRRLVNAYAELIQRPIEYCTISPDTTESSLKQTRLLLQPIQDDNDTTASSAEDRGGNAPASTRIVFQDQAPVRAALHGHLLVLDGLQNAERNVLPSLNNLLENRELPLEDGRLLVSPERYAYLMNNLQSGDASNSNSSSRMGDFLVPVHPDFRVVALFHLAPHASKLDPPVRSRFQIRRIDPQDAEECISWNEISQLDDTLIKDLMIFAKTINSESYNSNILQFPVTTAIPGIVRLLAEFPNTSPATLLTRAYPYANSDETRLSHAVQSWSAGNHAREHFQRVAMETNMLPKKKNSHIHPYHAEYQFTHVANIPDQPNPRIRQAHFASEHMSVSVNVWTGGKEIPTPNNSTSFVATSSSQTVLTAMMQEHAAGRDILLLGPKGEGKSILAEQFASILGYQIHRFPLYKDMTASDLLVRRSHTTSKSSSSSSSSRQYVESPLLQAARTGQICVLDGVEKLSPATLGTLQSLLTDREIHLPDGTKLCQTTTDEESSIHPSFRVIALASIPSTVSYSSSSKRSSSHVPISWLTEDVTSMFSTISMPAPSRECLLTILRPQNQQYSEDQLEQILSLQEKLSKEDCGVSPLSMRGLLRLVRRGSTEQNLHENLCKEFLADLLTPLQRASLESVMRSVGIVKPKNTPLTPSARAEDKVLDVRFDDTQVKIGDDYVITRRAASTNPELVPNPFFFDIPSQVHMIQTLLSEWDSGRERSFLLLGNQGTGKNKICDRICQLANLEREYMQLHRDSTIGQLTLTPTLEGGKVVWKDSPLVRAIKHGRALVIDEADKAPLEVVAVLKSLVEDGELLLADGRRILRYCTDDDTGESFRNDDCWLFLESH
jgi:MoxR-like ATPase